MISQNEKQFIEAHQHKSITEIVLLLSKHQNLDKTFILNQLNGLKKATDKLPEFAKNKNIIYSVPLSLEQCSSEETAVFKASMIDGNSLLDLTGGFGVDTFCFSKKFNQVTYIEQNEALFNIATSNFKTLNALNITAKNTSAEAFLSNNKQQFDVIYIDPARRNEAKKLFLLEDCSPAVLDLLPQLLEIAPTILIKTSPMLDIKKAIQQLKFVYEVVVVSLKNDCKEVLYLLKNKPQHSVKITTINLGLSNQHFSFTFEEEENAVANYSTPIHYLYEPNNSILKAGAFKVVASKLGLKKIALHSHLYTSEHFVKKFPGRVFRIKHKLTYQPKLFAELEIKKANISCRNFVDNVDEVKKKLKLKDGGAIYLFATTLANKKPMLIVCEKMDTYLRKL